MIMYKFCKMTGLIKGFIALCMMQQLVACSSDDAGSGSTQPPTISTFWLKPDYREDGTTLLTMGEIGGFRIYYGPNSGDYQKELNIMNDGSGIITVDDLPAGGTYYFVLTTYDTEGRESIYSPEFSMTL